MLAHEYAANAAWVSPFGYQRFNACLQLTVAFRRKPRPSSPLSALASPVRPYLLDHITSNTILKLYLFHTSPTYFILIMLFGYVDSHLHFAFLYFFNFSFSYYNLFIITIIKMNFGSYLTDFIS